MSDILWVVSEYLGKLSDGIMNISDGHNLDTIFYMYLSTFIDYHAMPSYPPELMEIASYPAFELNSTVLYCLLYCTI